MDLFPVAIRGSRNYFVWEERDVLAQLAAT